MHKNKEEKQSASTDPEGLLEKPVKPTPYEMQRKQPCVENPSTSHSICDRSSNIFLKKKSQ
jgi:hypothetical protein